jgi:GT2 family glycosyltransferase
MDVSIIIVNYNTQGLTEQCIKSVITHTAGIGYEIVLVDNASSSFHAESFKNEFPQVKLIISDKNLGFAGGNNLGIQHATGQYILLLNSDTYLKDNSITILADHLRSHPKAGVVSGRLIYPDGTHQSVCQRFPSLKYSFFEIFRLQKLLSRKKAGKILLGAFFDHTENAKADWVWGTFFMFKSALLKVLPGNKLDETFFMYCEDVQWCWDFKKLGYEVHYCANAEVIHLMGGSSGDKKNLIQKNTEIFMQKNYGKLHWNAIKFLQKLL